MSIKFISREDIIKSKSLELPKVMETIQNAFIDFYNGEILLPDKISQIFNEESQNRINCMPSTLLKQKISGVKWISVFPNNPKYYGIPNVSGLLVLSEIEKGLPIAVMEASLITTMRTAAIGAIASKYFAKKESKIYCSIGTGEQAKMHFLSIKEVHPEINVCKVASKTIEGEQSFIDFCKKRHPDVNFFECKGDFEAAALDSDIIVTAVSCQKPLLKAKTIKQGCFYCHVGGWEDEYAVPLKANKIVCDHWESVKHRSQTISRMYKENKLKDEDIYADMAEIICGKKLARENDEEFIYFNSVGLSFIDIAVASAIYKDVINNGLGKDVEI